MMCVRVDCLTCDHTGVYVTIFDASRDGYVGGEDLSLLLATHSVGLFWKRVRCVHHRAGAVEDAAPRDCLGHGVAVLMMQ